MSTGMAPVLVVTVLPSAPVQMSPTWSAQISWAFSPAPRLSATMQVSSLRLRALGRCSALMSSASASVPLYGVELDARVAPAPVAFGVCGPSSRPALRSADVSLARVLAGRPLNTAAIVASMCAGVNASLLVGSIPRS